VSKRKYAFYTKWQAKELECACLVFNPLCDKNKGCEELELTLNPYEDIEECMRERSYKRVGGALRQK
jgi:hypothetical protein